MSADEKNTRKDERVLLFALISPLKKKKKKNLRGCLLRSYE